MGQIYKADFQVDNGTDFDKYNFSTTADQVSYAKSGKETNVQAELDALNKGSVNMGAELAKYLPLSGGTVTGALKVNGELRLGTAGHKFTDNGAQYSGNAATATNATNATKAKTAESATTAATATNATNATKAKTAESATTATNATNAGRVGHSGVPSAYPMAFNWRAQPGQPTFLWGGEEPGTEMYVYTPSNFNVRSAGRSTGNAFYLNGDKCYVYAERTDMICMHMEYGRVTLTGNTGETYLFPDVDGRCYLGQSGKRWKSIYCATSTISTSDERLKEDIRNLDDDLTYGFIMGLEPISYKLVDGDSGRTHYGMSAQAVERLMEDMGMSSLDFAGFIKSTKKEYSGSEPDGEMAEGDESVRAIDGEFDYGLRYEEFIAPLIKVVQMQGQTLRNLREEVSLLKEEVAMLRRTAPGLQ